MFRHCGTENGLTKRTTLTRIGKISLRSYLLVFLKKNTFFVVSDFLMPTKTLLMSTLRYGADRLSLLV